MTMYGSLGRVARPDGEAAPNVAAQGNVTEARWFRTVTEVLAE